MKNERLIFFLAVVVAFIFRLLIAPNLTHTGDLLSFKAWALILSEKGLGQFYSVVWSDYLPGYLYVLFVLGNIYNYLIQFFTPSLDLDIYLFKMPSILTDLGNGFLVYLIVKKYISERSAFLTGVFALFSPAFFANSTLWGQADSVITFFVLLSLYLFTKEKLYMSAFVLGIAQTIKPIALLCLPIFLLHLFLKRVSIYKVLIYCIFFIATVILVFLPFNTEANIFEFILERHQVTANQYPYTSLNAFNFWSLASDFWVLDTKVFLGLSYHTLGLILFGLSYTVMAVTLLLKGKYTIPHLYFSLALVYFSMFIFLTRMHERHMFYAVGLMSLLLPFLPKDGKILVAVVNTAYTINLYYAYAQLNGKPAPFELSIVLILSALNIVVLLLLFCFFILGNEKYTD